MLQNIINLFNVELFICYLLLSVVYTTVLIKSYFFVLRGLQKGVFYKKFSIFIGVVVYGSMIAAMIYSCIRYGFWTVTVTGTVMYIIMYFPMKYLTKILDKKALDIIPNTL